MAKLFTCNFCSKEFDRKGKLYLHLLIHTKEKPFKCTFDNCACEFNRKHHLDQHFLVHTARPKPFECSECSSCFSTITLLKRHTLKLHSKTLQNLTDQQQETFNQDNIDGESLLQESEIDCHLCHQKLKKKSFKNHMKRIHDVLNYKHPPVQLKCELCSFVFNRVQAFKSHMKSKSHSGMLNTVDTKTVKEKSSNSNLTLIKNSRRKHF